jgi:hypothetical protein
MSEEKWQGKEITSLLQANTEADLNDLIDDMRIFASSNGMGQVQVLQKRKDPDGGYEAVLRAHNFNPIDWVKKKLTKKAEKTVEEEPSYREKWFGDVEGPVSYEVPPESQSKRPQEAAPPTPQEEVPPQESLKEKLKKKFKKSGATEEEAGTVTYENEDPLEKEIRRAYGYGKSYEGANLNDAQKETARKLDYEKRVAWANLPDEWKKKMRKKYEEGLKDKFKSGLENITERQKAETEYRSMTGGEESRIQGFKTEIRRVQVPDPANPGKKKWVYETVQIPYSLTPQQALTEAETQRGQASLAKSQRLVAEKTYEELRKELRPNKKERVAKVGEAALLGGLSIAQKGVEGVASGFTKSGLGAASAITPAGRGRPNPVVGRASNMELYTPQKTGFSAPSPTGDLSALQMATMPFSPVRRQQQPSLKPLRTGMDLSALRRTTTPASGQKAPRLVPNVGQGTPGAGLNPSLTTGLGMKRLNLFPQRNPGHVQYNKKLSQVRRQLRFF